MQKEYNYSEIFYSIQGEGRYTGIPTAWLRYFLCNLQCDGFGQKDPTDPKTYKLPYKDMPVDFIKRVEDLPVWKYGCDSSYSWAKKFKHLMHKGTPEYIANQIIGSIRTEHNMEAKFDHPAGQPIHMCFTGGEPLMKHAQDCTVGILDYFDKIKNSPRFITFETNATQALKPEFNNFMTNWREMGREIFISSSPKLWTTSGETNKDAIVPEVLAEYHSLSRGHGQIKYVVNGKKETWEEVEHVTNEFRKAGVTFPVWIMPVGATEEGQTGELEGYMSAGAIADQAFKRGFNVSARVHVYLWGNTIGV